VRTSSFSCSIILLVSWTSMIFSMVVSVLFDSFGCVLARRSA
jgi:hypothetical protein